MSETQKPVEETPAAAPAAAETTPAATETPAATTETPAAETEAPKENTEEPKPAATEETAEAAKPEEPKEAEKKEESKPTPATDGVLGYKAPGLVKGLRFSKRYFWFSDEAVEVKNLTTYFANEKHSISHPTGAWASQSGKGLLFFTKRAEDKATPTGIINMVDASDITKDGGSELHFKINGHKHTLQANSAVERDSWVAALEAKVTEAKAEKESIVESEGYKTELEKMTKPPVVGATTSAPKKSTELKTPKEEKTEGEAAAPAADKEAAKETAKETKEAKETGKETQKSRSQSRKRASIFGSFLKKEEPEKKEEETEAKEEAKPAEESATAETAAAAETPAAETSEPAAETTEAKPEEKKEEKKEEKTETKAEGTTTKNKRASIFGNIFQKVGSPTQEKSEKETAPAPPSKDKDTAVSSTAPQLGDPVDASASKPIEPESVTSPTEGEASKTTDAGTSPSSKSGLLSFMKKEKDGKKEAKTEEKTDKTEETGNSEAAASSEPAQTTKDKRRTSMFGSLGTKKEKKTEADGAESGSGAKSNKFGLFRKPSKAVKPTEKKEETAPTESEAIPEGGEKKETTEEATNGVESSDEKKEEKTIGDVAGDSVNVGPSNNTTVQAAA